MTAERPQKVKLKCLRCGRPDSVPVETFKRRGVQACTDCKSDKVWMSAMLAKG